MNYGHNFVVYEKRDGILKVTVIERYKEFSKNFHQSSRIENDLLELEKLSNEKRFGISTPQWTGHRFRPIRVLGSDNKLHPPLFVSEAIKW